MEPWISKFCLPDVEYLPGHAWDELETKWQQFVSWFEDCLWCDITVQVPILSFWLLADLLISLIRCLLRCMDVEVPPDAYISMHFTFYFLEELLSCLWSMGNSCYLCFHNIICILWLTNLMRVHADTEFWPKPDCSTVTSVKLLTFGVPCIFHTCLSWSVSWPEVNFVLQVNIWILSKCKMN